MALVWNAEEERLADITKTLDKVVVGLLFSGVAVFSTTAALAQTLTHFPHWASMLGITLSAVFLAAVVILGSLLICCRERVYRWWLKRRTSGELNVRTHTGIIVQCRKIEDYEVRRKVILPATWYTVTVRLDGAVDGEMRLEGVREVESAPDGTAAAVANEPVATIPHSGALKIGDRVRVIVTTHYSRRGHELLRKVTLYQNTLS